MGITIFNIGSYMFKNYILKTDAGWIIIDTGYPGGETQFLKKLQKFCSPDEIAYIFLTHAHDDHAGFLAALLDKTRAPVILHPAAVKALENGTTIEPPGSGFSTRLASLFSLVKKDYSYPPVHLGNRAIFVSTEADQPLLQAGLRVVFLPGHTADSIGLYLEKTGELFCGDAAMNAGISLARHTIWIDDVAEYGRTWDKIIALNPAKIYPSHGSPFMVQDLVKYRHFMAGKKTIKP